MLNRPIFYTQPVTLLIPEGFGSKIEFDEQPRLESAVILGIQAFSADQVAADSEARPVILAADCNIPLMTFKQDSVEKVEGIPYAAMIAQFNSGAYNQYNGLTVNWPKSYAIIPPGSAFEGEPPFLLYFNVDYIPAEVWAKLTPAEKAMFLYPG